MSGQDTTMDKELIIRELITKLEAEKQQRHFRGFLFSIRQLIDKHSLPPPTCFFTYAWENEDSVESKKQNKQLQKRLRRLSNDLRFLHIKTFLDVQDMQGDIKSWMSKSIKESHAFLVIGTPTYKRKFADEDGNTKYEFDFITDRLRETKNALLPLLFEGSLVESFPRRLQQHFVRDFRLPSNYYRSLAGYDTPLGLMSNLFSDFAPDGKFHQEYVDAYKTFLTKCKWTQKNLKKYETPIVSLPNIPNRECKSSSTAQIVSEAEKLWAKNTNESDKQAFTLLHNLYSKGERGHGTLYRLGTAYYYGRGIAKNLESAYDHFALIQHSRYALWYMGLIYSDNSFQKQDFRLALTYLAKAESMGVKEAVASIQKVKTLIP
jgi:hypothetical protein